ncbi:ABC-type transport auxiliary lipoprotein family protein [Immundisolibacter sp.]|uniref:ABC-type transport auxiliary lipoprotein family protein n=1 Tax=Immundisolibacter sp. TaxID=1934948 RepID=UPI000ED5AEEF|nr:hypothetical protein [Gammaproteobacteria bacterium]
MRLLIAAAVLLAGCSLPVTPPPADTTHTLAVPASAPMPAALPAQATLQVALPTVAPGYAGAAIAYRTAPHELRYYARQRWVDRPARLLQQALLDGLAAGGAQVMAPGSGARPDYRLLSNLVQLEQDFTTQPSRVRMTLRVQLVDVNQRRLLGGHTLRLEQVAASDDPAGGVAAANVLLQQAVQEVAEFCRRTVGG